MQHIAIIDFGSQYTHLISNRIRGLGVYTNIYQPTHDVSQEKDIIAIILSGGPNSVYASDAPQLHASIFDLQVPILGICYGHQLLAQALGGIVQAGEINEYGQASIEFDTTHPLFVGLESTETMRASHGDQVVQLPEGFMSIASTDACPITAMAHDDRRIYGVQFHPEVTHSLHGIQILKNFLALAHAETNRDPRRYTDQIIEHIRHQVSDRNVFMLVSGGVDSTVAFALIQKALGSERCYGLCIDNGLMRSGETQMVADAMSGLGYSNFHVHDASALFLEKLAGIDDPETKRKIIGDTFIQVQQEVLASLHLDPSTWMLGQGTIYPDVIESGGTKHASLIKTHHNRVPAIQAMIEAGLVIEPLVDLYKDEVRIVGQALGLPEYLVQRHPFPGPGLGIRVLCTGDQIGTITPLSEDEIPLAIPQDRSYTSGCMSLLPIRSVGAQGDARSYKHPIIIDKNIAYGPVLLERAKDLINSIHSANRVCYCLFARESLTKVIAYPKKYLTSERVKLLQEVDLIVRDRLVEHQLSDQVWQMPVVLLPLGFGQGETIVLRPIMSREAMTAHVVQFPRELLDLLIQKITTIETIDMVLYDCTHKPPATIEWE